jgi:hypothetical protein
MEERMTDDFTVPSNSIEPPIETAPTGEPKSKKTTWIIIAIIIVLLCCCCIIIGVLGYNYGDQVIEQLGEMGISF